MKLKQWGLKLGLALAAVGLLSVQAHAADGFDGAVEPLDLGAALPLVGEVQVAALEQVGSATPLPVAAAAASSSGPLGVEGSAALAAFSQADIATLFEPSAAPLQLAALSEQEMKETEGAVVPFLIGAFHAVNFARHAIGPVNAWVRMGPSFSRISQVSTYSIRWGSNKHHQKQIGSATLRNFNNSLHNSRLPGSSWRAQDRGHFHLRGHFPPNRK
ncbi:hypothetical protein [Serpentinimonas maccroryi]|uniref:hypothetical protein n=1 Tax=Serpentinimonas maccroryi TaxID=1458426 RepID=UPI0020333F2F|nr:hypothetical protein [Serpentinimonas maccroryi]MCM2480253.1 hypothetical protein [Serpentinimonas maccroryi]